ncbi:MAG: hypothetical protein Q7N50_11010 [Armatimonadota bacterium]|nr:hypothetical protein [Armatimonadota bacterium]
MYIRGIIAMLVAAVATGIWVERSFTKSSVVTISQAANGMETRVIALAGRVYPLGDNRFLLVDGTGKVEIETCPTWYKEIFLKPGERITLTGERLAGQPTAEGAVFVISALNIDGGESGNITIREHLGKPPWALSKKPSTPSIAVLGKG